MKVHLNLQVFIIMALLLMSCDVPSVHSIHANNEIRSEFKKYGESFGDHFPEEITNSDFSYLKSENTYESHPRIWLKYEPSRSSFKKIKENAMLKAKAVYAADDSCLLVIDKHLTENNSSYFDKNSRNGRKFENIVLVCHSGKLPVPKFWNEGYYETGETDTGLKPDYNLYVIEAKSGMFIDENKLPNGKYTPEDWEHGYSKGIAINENSGTVIFWFDIW